MRVTQGSIRLPVAVLAMALSLSSASALHARELSIEQRIEAHASIERLYHEHRQGATTVFEQAVPASVLRRVAEEGPRLSIALERFWNAPVTDDLLDKELTRIARDTRLPERLKRLFAALGNDAFLIKETLVRRAVANRLARRLFAADERLRLDFAGEPRTWDEWWSETAPTLSLDSFSASAGDSSSLPEIDDGGCTDGLWNNRSLDDVPDPRRFATAVWTGAEMIVWGG
ncbi:MAG: hypothetical protein JSV80_05790, partial [Acidobacteriota bacterium]